MVNFFIGLLLGMLQVGAHSYKMICVIDRKPIKAVLSSLTVSVIYLFSIKVIIANELVIYFGFSIGAAIITVILSMRKPNLPKED